MNTPLQQADNRRRWTEALRSGQYQQIAGAWEDGKGGYCGLGLIRALSTDLGIIDLLDWTGLSRNQLEEIAYKNDYSTILWPFPRLADLIDQWSEEIETAEVVAKLLVERETYVNTDLLLTLANRLERDVPKGGWDFGIVWESSDGNECGTLGCAMGWAAHWGGFGLTIDRYRVVETSDRQVQGAFDAAAVAFDISIDDSLRLFGGEWDDEAGQLYPQGLSRDVTPADVAAAIRKLVGAVPMTPIVVEQGVRV